MMEHETFIWAKYSFRINRCSVTVFPFWILFEFIETTNHPIHDWHFPGCSLSRIPFIQRIEFRKIEPNSASCNEPFFPFIEIIFIQLHCAPRLPHLMIIIIYYLQFTFRSALHSNTSSAPRWHDDIYLVDRHGVGPWMPFFWCHSNDDVDNW